VQANAQLQDPHARADEHMLDDDPLIISATVQFENGVTGLISAVGGSSVRVAGLHGVATLYADGHTLEVRSHKGAGRVYYFNDVENLAPEPSPSGTQRAFASLAQTLQNGAPPPIQPQEILAGQTLLMGMAWSHLHQGRRTTPKEIAPGFTVSGRSGTNYA